MAIKQPKPQIPVPAIEPKSRQLLFDRAFRYLLTAWIVLSAVVIRYHAVSGGLDHSWAYAINLLASKGFVFGKDVGFTYGPFGYLMLPMNVGVNLWKGIAFQFDVWLLFASIVVWLAIIRRVSLLSLGCFAMLLFAGLPAFDRFGFTGPDTFIAFTALLLLGCAATEKRWLAPFLLAQLLAAVLFLIKFSSAVTVLSAILIYAAALVLQNRKKALRLAPLAFIGTPLLFTLAFLFYHPSPAVFMNYVRLGLEISAGYSTAMSYPSGANNLSYALALLLIYAVALALVFWKRRNIFPLWIAMAGPLFLTFKHSFVREPGHSGIFFMFVPLAWAVVLLFTDLSGPAKWHIPAVLAITLGIWFAWEGPALVWQRFETTSAGLNHARSLADIFRIDQIQHSLDAVSASELARLRLPLDFPAVGTGIFPAQIAYAAANSFRYQPFPIFQTYCAYTAFLDKCNATALADPATAPQRILFEWDAIDARHPLLDVPAMGLEFFRHYEIVSSDHPTLVLQRRAQPAFRSMNPTSVATLTVAKPFPVPQSIHPLIARLHQSFSLRGRLLRFLFRVPEIQILLRTRAGRTELFRVPPEVLENGVLLNFLPLDRADFISLLSGTAIDQVQDITIGGEGMSSIIPEIPVEIFEISDWNLRPAPPLEPRTSRGNIDSLQAETINGISVAGHVEVIPIPNQFGFVRVQGWAVDGMRDEAAAGVEVSLDGKPFRASFGRPRPDIAALRHCPECANAGFEWTTPTSELGTATHTLTFRILNKDGKSAYDTDRVIRLVAVP